jgi:hypothetical protein
MASKEKKPKSSIVHHHEEKSIMYFRIDNPVELRKEILKTAIDTTQLLKRYESFKALHHLRSEVYQDFNRSYKELEILTKKLGTKDLPVIERIQEDVKKARNAEEKIAHIKQQPISMIERPIKEDNKEEKHYFSEEDRLDSELMDIKSRLRKLDSE